MASAEANGLLGRRLKRRAYSSRRHIGGRGPAEGAADVYPGANRINLIARKSYSEFTSYSRCEFRILLWLALSPLEAVLQP